MNYEEMSDLEINSMVISRIYTGAESPIVSKAYPGASENLTIGSSARVIYSDQTQEIVNFCNDWGCAGQIIADNNFDLTSPLGSGIDEWQVSRHSIHHSRPSIFAFDKNPLRAAMICFLKMKDAENGKH